MLKSTLLKAVESAGKELQYYMDINYEVTNKPGVNNLVTEADLAAEKAILNTIKSNFPDHHILSEEVGEIIQDSNYKWIIDPIDGTVNFAHKIPLCCVSIGVEFKNEIILGAVYNPFLNELFVAEKNSGATLNEKPIRISSKEKLENACMVTGFPYVYSDAANSPLQIFGRFIKKGIPIRRLGSAAIDLCWVACGRFDAFYEENLFAWDTAAGYLMVQEAGGTVTDYKGNSYSPYHPYIVASNGVIHEQLLKWIEET